MAYTALYLMALVCIIWGSIRSLRFIQAQISKKEPLECSITTREAKKFPITASLCLFTLYVVFKINSDGSAFFVEKVRPYASDAVMAQVDWAVEKLIGKATAVVNATAGAVKELPPHPGYVSKLGECQF